MSLRQYALQLRFSLRPSKILKSFIIAVHVLTLFVLWLLPVPTIFMVLLFPVLVFSAVRVMGRYGLLADKNRINEIIHTGEGDWKLLWSDGSELYAVLEPDSYRHPLMTILNFRVGSKKIYSVVLLPDSIDTENFRRLRVLII